MNKGFMLASMFSNGWIIFHSLALDESNLIDMLVRPPVGCPLIK